MVVDAGGRWWRAPLALAAVREDRVDVVLREVRAARSPHVLPQYLRAHREMVGDGGSRSVGLQLHVMPQYQVSAVEPGRKVATQRVELQRDRQKDVGARPDDDG